MPRRRVRVPAPALVVACVLAWLVALSGRAAVALASRDLLPEGMGRLVWPRGTTGLVRGLAAVLGLVLVTWVAARLAHRWWVTAPVAVLGVLAAVSAPVVPYPGVHVAFAAMRPALDEVAGLAEASRTDRLSEHLPPHLADVAAHGTVTTGRDGSVFVPQWAGIPDDAGGFWHTPGTTPEGRDMGGMWCEDPTRLDGDWWVCGMQVEAGGRW